MKFRRPLLVAGAFAAAGLLAPLDAQGPAPRTAGEARAQLSAARQQQRNAALRGERLERQASAARAGADQALALLAALAARVQQSEAALSEAEARYAVARADRAAIAARLARQREPLARLAGAVETLSRRPVTLAILQPGSLTDLVHTRAILAGVAPQVERRTRGLREELVRLHTLEVETGAALADTRDAQAALDAKRRDLSALAESQRLTARRAQGDAGREAARAMVLAEEARDLDALVAAMETDATLRGRLAALGGPILRPANPQAASRIEAESAALPSASSLPRAAPVSYQLPVEGRITAGFGTKLDTGTRRPGIALAPRPGAQVVAPGGGRIAFAGPYRGYGQIVIIEHAGGWTSLVTGLASVGVTVGQQMRAGSPLGRAAADDPAITLELRREGVAVNPLDHLQ